MVEQRPGPEPERQEQPAASSAAGRSPGWLLPVAALLAGLLLGGGAVSLTSGDDEVDLPRALPSPAPAPLPSLSPRPLPAGSDVLIRVPEPCVRVAGDAETAVQALDELAVAVRDFEARRLQEIIDRLQTLRPQVEARAEQCREEAGRGIVEGDLVQPAPPPTPS